MTEVLNPTDTDLIKYIKKTNTTVHELTTARQEYKGTWFDLNHAEYTDAGAISATYPNNFYVTVTGLGNTNLSDKFVIGDKFRVKQTGYTDYRYFYLVGILDSSDRLTLAGDKDALLNGATITSIGHSNATLPVGFPTVMFFDANVYGESSNIINYCYFRMVGNMVTVTFIITSNSNDVSYAINPPTVNARQATYQYIGVTDGTSNTLQGTAWLETVSIPPRIQFSISIISGTAIIASDFASSGVKSVDGKLDYPVGDSF